MRLGTAIEHLIDNVRLAESYEFVNDKVAWALYQTWKEADRENYSDDEFVYGCKETTYVKPTDCAWK